jgi:Domain of unknown function (DUF4926)
MDDGTLVRDHKVLNLDPVGDARPMTFRLYTDVALAHDLPKYRLCRGDLVRLVEHHVSPAGEEGYSAEVLGAKGHTLAVIAVATKSLEALRDDEVLSVRAMAI